MLSVLIVRNQKGNIVSMMEVSSLDESHIARVTKGLRARFPEPFVIDDGQVQAARNGYQHASFQISKIA